MLVLVLVLATALQGIPFPCTTTLSSFVHYSWWGQQVGVVALYTVFSLIHWNMLL
jgi:hypothetical protein